jgi:putative hemolysin
MVGEIHDEFDVVERPLNLPDGSMIFDAAINVRDLETQYNIAIPDDPSYETIGGFILNRLGFIPRGGESFEANGYRFTVMEMDHRRVSRVKIKALRAPVASEPLQGAPAEEKTAPVAQPRPKAKAAGKSRGESPRTARRKGVRESAGKTATETSPEQAEGSGENTGGNK